MFCTPFFTAGYIIDRLVLQTTYDLNKEILLIVCLTAQNLKSFKKQAEIFILISLINYHN